jgi:hypothetical protein
VLDKLFYCEVGHLGRVFNQKEAGDEEGNYFDSAIPPCFIIISSLNNNLRDGFKNNFNSHLNSIAALNIKKLKLIFFPELIRNVSIVIFTAPQQLELVQNSKRNSQIHFRLFFILVECLVRPHVDNEHKEIPDWLHDDEGGACALGCLVSEFNV